jgi:hypothetical protein
LQNIAGLKHEGQPSREIDWLLNSIGIAFIACLLKGDGVWAVGCHGQVERGSSRFKPTSFVVIDSIDEAHVLGHCVAMLNEERVREREELRRWTHKVWRTKGVLHDHPTMRKDHKISDSCARLI